MFVIEGKPQGKLRPRFYRGRAVTPKATREYEEKVRKAFLESGSESFMDGEPIIMWITAYYPIPTRARKAERVLMESGEMWPTSRPDIDNVIKVIMDGLNGAAYADDSQVIRIEAKKKYSKTPYVEVVLREAKR